ncbi:hypothetical protein GCM10023178_35990 [Actinomadura luteofluorescens]
MACATERGRAGESRGKGPRRPWGSLETLREKKGRDQEGDQQDGQRQSDSVLYGHSRSTAFTTSANTAKTATVSRMNARSDISRFLGGRRAAAMERRVLVTPAPASGVHQAVNGTFPASPQVVDAFLAQRRGA